MTASGRLVVQFACAIAVPILYIASSGPVLHFCSRHRVVVPLVSAIYKPLFRISITQDFVIRYLMVLDPKGDDEFEGLFMPAF